MEFTQEYMNEPFSQPPAHRYAWEYLETCERFDATVCRRMRNGIAHPVEPHEMKIINRNARLVRDRLSRQMHKDGLAPSIKAAGLMLDESIRTIGPEFEKHWRQQAKTQEST